MKKTLINASRILFLIFMIYGIYWAFIRSPKDPKEALSYISSSCGGVYDSKNCNLADGIVDKYYLSLSNDEIINKLIKTINNKNIKCEWQGKDIIPECIAMKIRISQIDIYKIADPWDIIDSYNSFQALKAERQKQLDLLNKNTRLAESILANYQGDYKKN